MCRLNEYIKHARQPFPSDPLLTQHLECVWPCSGLQCWPPAMSLLALVLHWFLLHKPVMRLQASAHAVPLVPHSWALFLTSFSAPLSESRLLYCWSCGYCCWHLKCLLCPLGHISGLLSGKLVTLGHGSVSKRDQLISQAQ